VANEYDDLLKKNFGPRSGTEYDQIVDSQIGSSLETGVKRSMFVAQSQEPDRMAEAVKVSRDLKVDTQFAYQNLDPLKKKVEEERFNYPEMAKEYPGLAAWFGKPENAAVGRDDLEPLKVIDRYGFSFKRRQRGGPESNIVSENIEAFQSGWNNLGASAVMLGAAYGLLDPEEAAVNIASFQSKSRALQDRAPAYAKEFQEIMSSQMEDIDEAINKVYGSWDQIKEGNILRGLMDFNAGVIETPAEVLDMLASWAIRPRGAIRAVSENLAYSLPALAAGQLSGIAGAKAGAAAGAPFGPVGAATGAGVGGIAGFAGGFFLGGLPVEIGASLSEDLSKRGFDLTNAEDLVRAFSDENLIKDLRGRAQRKGITTSAVDSLFALFAGRLVSKAGPGANILQRAGTCSGGCRC
jgi:predicted transcriptional regulator